MSYLVCGSTSIFGCKQKNNIIGLENEMSNIKFERGTVKPNITDEWRSLDLLCKHIILEEINTSLYIQSNSQRDPYLRRLYFSVAANYLHRICDQESYQEIQEYQRTITNSEQGKNIIRLESNYYWNMAYSGILIFRRKVFPTVSLYMNNNILCFQQLIYKTVKN